MFLLGLFPCENWDSSSNLNAYVMPPEPVIVFSQLCLDNW